MRVIISLLVLVNFFYTWSCVKIDEQEKSKVNEQSFFLSGIRPIYFNKLNFDSPEIRKEIPEYLATFKSLFETTLVSSYLDKDLSFDYS